MSPKKVPQRFVAYYRVSTERQGAAGWVLKHNKPPSPASSMAALC